MSMLVMSDQLQIVRGSLTAFQIHAASGNLKTNYFCARCGTMIYNTSEARPFMAVVRPGALDDTSQIAAQAHIWTCSKQPWLELPEGVPVFDKAYDPQDIWPEESLSRLKRALARAT
jgi:hypothetical protein